MIIQHAPTLLSLDDEMKQNSMPENLSSQYTPVIHPIIFIPSDCIYNTCTLFSIKLATIVMADEGM